MKHLLSASSIILVLFFTTNAAYSIERKDIAIEDILTRENQDQLCREGPNGELYVSKNALAQAMFVYLGLPISLVLENKDKGTEENILELFRKGTLEGTPVGKEFNKKYERLYTTFIAFIKQQKVRNGAYSIHLNLKDLLSLKENGQLSLKPTDFFGRSGEFSKFSIKCNVISEEEVVDSNGNFFKEWPNYFRIRGNVKDLSTAKITQNSKESSAQLSFTDDKEKEEQTVQVDGVLGIPLEMKWNETPFQFIPFVEYHNKDTNKNGGDDERVESLILGASLDVVEEAMGAVWQITMVPQYVFDKGEHAEYWRGEAIIDPAFTIGSNFAVGRYNILSDGNVWIKPEIYGLLEAGWIEKEGTNPILEKSDEFFGYGAQASVSVTFPKVPALGNIVFSTSYRHVELSSLPIDDASKWIVSADYKLNGAKNFILGLRYENGRNDKTYQNEEFWRVALGVRF